MAKSKPVATIIREALISVSAWDSGYSRTYQDTSYTKQSKKTCWASKYLDKMNEAAQLAVKAKLESELAGRVELVLIYDCEVRVYQSSPISIIETV